MTEPLVFIAYSQADEAEKEQLLAHLNVLRQAGRLDLWSEARIGYGREREAAIKAAMAEAQVALLLLSANFFSSDELLDRILPQLLAKQAQNELTIIPVLAKACAWTADARLAKLAIFPNDHKPIWGGDPGRVDDKLAELAGHLARTLGLPLEQVAPPEEGRPAAPAEASLRSIGGVSFSHLSGSTVTTGDIDASVRAGGDVVGGDKVTQTTIVNRSVFDQRGQQVGTQYNIAGDYIVGPGRNRTDVIVELEKLQAELAKASQANLLDEETATDAEYQLKKAVQQAKKPEPQQKAILDHLQAAKSGLEGGAPAGDLVTALAKVVELVRKFF